jgi:hypothetical protein
MGIGKKITTFTIDSVEGGCNYLGDLTEVTQTQSPNAMNMEFASGVWRKRKGYTALTTAVGAVTGHSLVDFGNVSGVHKQVAHFGTSVYALSNLAGSLTAIRTGAPDVRSYNARIYSYLIQTYSDGSSPYYWDGTSAAMGIVAPGVPGFKRSMEFQGFLMGMGTLTHPMRIYYQATSNMIGASASYTDYFTLTPAPNDDEITQGFMLNGRMYAASKYSIFRVSFVGGTTVFEFKQVISDVGVIPETLQVVVTRDYGQAALFMGTDRRVYLFDGANIKSISDLYYDHTDECDISMDLVDNQYIENSFAVFDTLNRVYRLFVTRLGATTNYYCMNVDVDTFAFYPYDNMEFASGAMCYDSIGRHSLICADYAGGLFKMFPDCNHDAGEVINEFYDSPLVSAKDPTTKQGQNLTLLLEPVSNRKLILYDKIDFQRDWKKRLEVPMAHSRDRFLGVSAVLGGTAVLGSEYSMLRQQINLPVAFNTYQFRLTTDADQTNTPYCSFTQGSVSGSSGGTTVTLTAGTWPASLTAANGYRIWVKDGGLNQMTTQTFDRTAADTATVSILAASAFSDVSYEVYRSACDACAAGWTLFKMEFNSTVLSVGKAEAQR